MRQNELKVCFSNRKLKIIFIKINAEGGKNQTCIKLSSLNLFHVKNLTIKNFTFNTKLLKIKILSFVFISFFLINIFKNFEQTEKKNKYRFFDTP